MPAFASSEELERGVCAFFRHIAASDSGRSVADADIVTAFVFREPEGRVVLDGRTPPQPGEHFVVHAGEAGPKADVSFIMTSEVAERVFRGEIGILQAIASGKIRAAGAVHKALRLVPAVSGWIPLYVEWRRSQE
jgi:hypothetical protein